MPDFSIEERHFADISADNDNVAFICGIDEVGRGPLAGPVVSAAVVFPLFIVGGKSISARHKRNKSIPDGITDSKKLSAKKRELIYDELINGSCIWAIGMSSVEEIDKMNILQASLLSMKRAFISLHDKLHRQHEDASIAATALIDGIYAPDIEADTLCIKKGDSKSISIAAASIIAKVTRDRIMQRIAEEYPNYGFEQHAGYGTKSHIEAIRIYGITEHHRKSFSPISRISNQLL